MDAKDREDAFLAGEYEQAWNHFRHLENARSQYLGFWFAASVACAAFAAVVLHSSGDKLVSESLSAGAFLVVFNAFTFFVLASVRRWGSVLLRYQDAMEAIRARRIALFDLPEGGNTYLSPAVIGAPMVSSRVLGAQRSADLTLTAFLVVGTLLLLLLGVLAVGHLNWAVPAIDLSEFVLSAVGAAYSIVIGVQLTRKKPQP